MCTQLPDDASRRGAETLDAHEQVRVDAVMAARSFIDAYSEDAVEEIKGLVPALLDQIFKLMAEVRPRSPAPGSSWQCADGVLLLAERCCIWMHERDRAVSRTIRQSAQSVALTAQHCPAS